jgi:hypothetical protein
MDTKCCDHLDTYAISRGLYVERYRTFCAGVFGELTDCYLTDSTSFRQRIGSYDEHERFSAKLNRNNVEAYNFELALIPDTIDKKSISKEQLWQFHHSDTSLLTTSPLFGRNTIECDDNFYPASSYKTDDGYFMKQVQYKCGNEFLNAVFYTDTQNFCVFIGVYNPGSFENNYSVKRNSAGDFDFYNITERQRVDTVKTEVYRLSELKKGKLISVCKQSTKK